VGRKEEGKSKKHTIERLVKEEDPERLRRALKVHSRGMAWGKEEEFKETFRHLRKEDGDRTSPWE